MTWEQTIGFALVIMAMFVGMIGCLLPAIPGTPLIFLMALAHRLYFGSSGPSNIAMVLLFALMVLSLALDYLASVLGAKKLGATWRGVLGALLGLMIGVFFSLPGLILGPFLGALLLEMLGKREFNDAARAGVGAMLGVFLGAAGKLACAAAMIGIFAVNVISRSGATTTISGTIGLFGF